MNTRIRTSCLILLSLGAVASGCMAEQPPVKILPWVVDLQADGFEAAARKIPIVLLISSESCGYCDRLKALVLEPMIKAEEFADRALLRELSLDTGFELVNFDGKGEAGAQFAKRYQAVLTPTVLFLDARGRQLDKPMTGLSNIEYYAFYLNRQITDSIAQMNNQD